MKKLLFLLLLLSGSSLFAQSHLDQNGIRTSVLNGLQSSGVNALRYEIADIGYNSYHWQQGGLIIIELFHQYRGSGYEKYILEIGASQGFDGGSPVLKLAESYGIFHLGKVSLGPAYDQSSYYGDYINRVLPIYVDVTQYATYKVKITYLQDRVETITGLNQIKVNLAPAGVSITDFASPAVISTNIASSGNLLISGTGNHYIQNGNVGIGTTTPGEKLAVNGNIRAKEIKVEAANWPDYVFEPDYKVTSLPGLEKYIRDHKHLPDVPPAAEAEKDGVSLGEMNKILLKKMEEMTLLMIELQKEVMAQGKQVADQEKQIMLLKTPLKR